MTTIKVIAAKPETPGGMIPTCGTRLFVNDTEITNLETFAVKTDFGDANDIPKTTVIFTVFGSVVDMERAEGASA